MYFNYIKKEKKYKYGPEVQHALTENYYALAKNVLCKLVNKCYMKLKLKFHSIFLNLIKKYNDVYFCFPILFYQWILAMQCKVFHFSVFINTFNLCLSFNILLSFFKKNLFFLNSVSFFCNKKNPPFYNSLPFPTEFYTWEKRYYTCCETGLFYLTWWAFILSIFPINNKISNVIPE